MSRVSKIDLLYRRFVLTKFYTKGWGKPEDLKEILQMHKLISNREACSKFVKPDYDVKIEKEIKLGDCTLLRGNFVTPLKDVMPKLVPNPIQTAHFEVVLPKNGLAAKQGSINPACIHMAGTGDHGFSRRRDLIAKPLLKSGIVSILLENPFYGIRKPKEQWKSGLLKVSDLFVMGGCLVLEAQVLLHWLKRMGYGPLGLTGISMGGHMASLAATNWPEPIALIPCMSWTSASVVWTDGVLSRAVPWRVLESQYAGNPKYEEEILALIDQVDSYNLGRNFAKASNGENQLDLAVKSSALVKKSNSEKLEKERRQRDTVQFMRGVMDQLTHLANFSKPVDPSLVTFIVAKGDAYFPKSNLQPMDSLWPECQIREFDGGHIEGVLVHYPECIRAIVDTFQRLLEKRRTAKESANSDTEVSNETMQLARKSSQTIQLQPSRMAIPFAIKVWMKALMVKS